MPSISPSPTRTARPKVRLSDVARRASVSVSTVSKALADHPLIGDETKQHVRKVSEQLGYRRSKPNVPSRIGLMVIGNHLRDGSYSRTLHNLMLSAREAGIRLEATAMEKRDPSQALKPLREFIGELSGVIMTGYVDQALLKCAHDAGLPCVVLGHILHKSNEPVQLNGCMVTGDHSAMGQLATSRLIAAGHQRVGFVCETLPKGLEFSRWLDGYHLAHVHANLKVDPSLICVAGRAFAGGAPAAETFAKMSKPPTAWLIPDARTAASFILTMNAQNKTVKKEDLIIGSEPDFAEQHGLSDWPMIYNDSRQATDLAFSLLMKRIDRSMPAGIELIVPAQSRNLPVSGDESL